MTRSLFVFVLAALVAMASPAHAGRDKPLMNLENVQIQWLPGVEPSHEKVRRAIVVACTRLGWECTEVSPTELHGHLSLRQHQAEIRIPYSELSYSLVYQSSVALRYDPIEKTIHRNYNNWILNLQRNINAEIADSP